MLVKKKGLLVPDNDDVAMAIAVIQLLSDNGLAEALSRKGRQMASEFSWMKTKPKCEEVISEVMRI